MSVIEGLWFFAVVPPRNRSVLVEYRGLAERGRFRRANAVHRPVLFFRDWWSLRVDGRTFEGEGPDPLFLGPLAFAPSPWIAPEASCDIAFLSERRIPLTLVVLRDGQVFDAVPLDFRTSPLAVHTFAPGVEGRFSFVLETAAGPSTVLTLSAVPTPGEPVPSASDFVPKEIPQEDEELLWSLRDGLSEDDLRSVSVASFFPEEKAGPAKLLDTLKFLPAREELRLVSELLRKDPSTGLAVLRSFPYELLFRLKPEVLASVLAAMDDRMLGLVWASASTEEREALRRALPPSRTPRPPQSRAVDWDDFREAVRSLATACLQRLSGAVVTTASRTVTVYERGKRSSPASAPAGLLAASVAPSGPVLRHLTCDRDAVFLELLRDAELLQLVVDDLSLSRETLLEYRGLGRGTVLRLPCPGAGLRVKAAVLDATGLREQLLAVTKTVSTAAELLGRSGHRRILKTPAEETVAFLVHTADDGSLVLAKTVDLRERLGPFEAHTLTLWHTRSHRTGRWHAKDLPDLLMPPPHPVRAPAAPPLPRTVPFDPLAEQSDERIADILHDLWRLLSLQDDPSPTGLGVRLRTAYWLSRLLKEERWIPLLPVLARLLYAAVLQRHPLPPGERLDLLFDLRLPLAETGHEELHKELERVLGLVRPATIPKPTLLRAKLSNLFARLLEENTVPKSEAAAVLKPLRKERETKTVLQALLLAAIAAPEQSLRTFRSLGLGTLSFRLPDEAAAFLTAWELSLSWGRCMTL